MTGDANEIEQEVARRAGEFDPIALLDLLRHLGYGPEDVVLESQFAASSPAALVQAVAFRKEPIRQVVITLNVGLLGPNSPLPSYFRQLLSNGQIDDAAFLEFLHFFDHKVLESWLAAIYPERDPAIFKDWDRTKKSYLSLLGVRSSGTLHWAFQLAFPELGVRVERAALARDVKLDATRLGTARLGGDTVLGGWTRVPVPGFTVTLSCDEEHTDFGHPWVEEVRRRLDGIIFPAIGDSAVDLRVCLVIRSEKVWARLSPTSYLGFDRIRGGAQRAREVLVWKGQVAPGGTIARRGAGATAPGSVS